MDTGPVYTLRCQLEVGHDFTVCQTSFDFHPRGISARLFISDLFGPNQVFIDRCPEMVQVETAKDTMPIAAVALSGPESIERFFLLSFRKAVDHVSHVEHLLVNIVALRVFNEEISPESASEEWPVGFAFLKVVEAFEFAAALRR